MAMCYKWLHHIYIYIYIYIWCSQQRSGCEKCHARHRFFDAGNMLPGLVIFFNLSREDVLCLSKWIVGVYHIATRLVLITLPLGWC